MPSTRNDKGKDKGAERVGLMKRISRRAPGKGFFSSRSKKAPSLPPKAAAESCLVSGKWNAEENLNIPNSNEFETSTVATDFLSRSSAGSSTANSNTNLSGNLPSYNYEGGIKNSKAVSFDESVVFNRPKPRGLMAKPMPRLKNKRPPVPKRSDTSSYLHMSAYASVL